MMGHRDLETDGGGKTANSKPEVVCRNHGASELMRSVLSMASPRYTSSLRDFTDVDGNPSLNNARAPSGEQSGHKPNGISPSNNL